MSEWRSISGFMSRKEWNAWISEKMHKGEPCPCPGCSSFGKDYKTILLRRSEIWLGGCKKCSDSQSKEMLDYYDCTDLFRPIAK